MNNETKLISESFKHYLNEDTKVIEAELMNQKQIENKFNVKVNEHDRDDLYFYPTAEDGMAYNMKSRSFVPVYDLRVYNASMNKEYFKDLYKYAIANQQHINTILKDGKVVSKSKIGEFGGYIEKITNLNNDGSSIIKSLSFEKMFVVKSNIEDPLLFDKLSHAKDYCYKVGIFKNNDGNLSIEESKQNLKESSNTIDKEEINKAIENLKNFINYISKTDVERVREYINKNFTNKTIDTFEIYLTGGLTQTELFGRLLYMNEREVIGFFRKIDKFDF